MNLTRRAALRLAASTPLVMLGAGTALASTPEIYAEGGIAINGHDPVAYFTDARPVRGNPALSHDWKGATWHFASAQARARFAADPEAFAPRYGGWCAYAVARGYTATTSPNAWHIHEGRLYLNYNRAVRALWLRDVPGEIARADANWPGVLGA